MHGARVLSGRAEKREFMGSGKSFYVTTPIYYVNDRPHIGHAYTTIAADALARFHRAEGRDVFFLTGVDEHGQKVEKAAKAGGIEPQAHADAMAPRFLDLWKRLSIEPSAFIRTTDAAHRRVVGECLEALKAKGLIEKRDFEGWYCTPCERYWTEKDLDEGRCPDCRRPVETLREGNYFFLMSRYAEWLKGAIAMDRIEIVPRSRKNEVLGKIEEGVKDLCISRPRHRLGWGVPIPFDPEYVTYVWFDALVNYLSGPRYLPGGDGRWPADVHIIGKDIIVPHCIYWPCMLHALDLPLPRRIVAHGWWNYSGEKMSKSRGNVVDPADLIDEYSKRVADAARVADAGGIADAGSVTAADERPSVDALRYFVLSEVTFGLDGVFSLEAFERRWTSDLSNDLGNLVSRVTSLVQKVCGGSVQSAPDESHRAIIGPWSEAMESLQFSKASEIAIRHAREINGFLQERKPWSNPPDASATLGRAVASIRLLASLLDPFIPASSALMARALGCDRVVSARESIESFEAKVTPPPPPLFARPERASAGAESTAKPQSRRSEKEKRMTESESVARPAPDAESVAPDTSGFATIEDLKRLGLRVGVVLTAERVEKTKKLLKLTVDIGSEERTLIAGIAEHYDPANLPGTRVVVVTNLQPAIIRGIESRGMILAASDDVGLSLVAPLSERAAGAEVR
jgi:methionyl-tRNA synthetase